MSMGSNIKELRKKKKLSQEELGKLIDTHLTNVGRYERDMQTPSADIIKKLAVIFEVSADQLLFDNYSDFPTSKITDKKVAEYMEALDGLPEGDKEIVFGVIEAMVVKNEMGRISKKAGRGK